MDRISKPQPRALLSAPMSRRGALLPKQDGAPSGELLVREVRHRLTNSLQLVASALMLGALATKSDEARGHLHSAHSRIMAIAELERRLCTRSTDLVDLHDYLDDLCRALSASVIIDANRVRIAVSAPSVQVGAVAASSLGMIVAELVTNAQKYAFPEGLSGTITVAYEVAAGGWRLLVSDNGVGSGAAPSKPGLGSEIVRALSQQLGASVAVERNAGGATISVASIGGERPTPRRVIGSHVRRLHLGE